MRRIFGVLFVICALIVVALSQDRPRSTQPATPAPSPSPTPAAQPQRPATPSQTPATPTQRPGDRIAPTLGEPPPVPKLKPTPTPTPPETIESRDTITINAELVQLHV
ncbi:MAG TPA: hypothetical protein VGW58_14995, partial [Pyrinomonadaceae bacterium]|nr:hypothetical protein [Pyrinomonadaceae bacterium]